MLLSRQTTMVLFAGLLSFSAVANSGDVPSKAAETAPNKGRYKDYFIRIANEVLSAQWLLGAYETRLSFLDGGAMAYMFSLRSGLKNLKKEVFDVQQERSNSSSHERDLAVLTKVLQEHKEALAKALTEAVDNAKFSDPTALSTSSEVSDALLVEAITRFIIERTRAEVHLQEAFKKLAADGGTYRLEFSKDVAYDRLFTLALPDPEGGVSDNDSDDGRNPGDLIQAEWLLGIHATGILAAPEVYFTGKSGRAEAAARSFIIQNLFEKMNKSCITDLIEQMKAMIDVFENPPKEGEKLDATIEEGLRQQGNVLSLFANLSRTMRIGLVHGLVEAVLRDETAVGRADFILRNGMDPTSEPDDRDDVESDNERE